MKFHQQAAAHNAKERKRILKKEESLHERVWVEQELNTIFINKEKLHGMAFFAATAAYN